MLSRAKAVRQVQGLLKDYPVVAIIGGRQVGKTTLAHAVARRTRGRVTTFDMEDPTARHRLSDPMAALGPLRGLVIIDEVQHAPEVFRPLRVLADRPNRPARFLILGSAEPGLLRQSSESLAGRIAYHTLAGFSLAEVGPERAESLWLRGRFPDAFLAKSDAASLDWRRNFVNTYLQRDLPELGITLPSVTLRRFWTMLAHYHGQTWNASEFSRSFGVSDPTVRRYLDILTSTFAVRQLLAWKENIRKRQVRAPKIYLADPGILHALFSLETMEDLLGHPKMGASWEGYALDQVAQQLEARPEDCFYWGTHTGAELDLLVTHGRRRYGFEFKRNSAPGLTPSMRVALQDLGLARLDVIYPGNETFPLADKVRAVGLARILEDLPALR